MYVMPAYFLHLQMASLHFINLKVSVLSNVPFQYICLFYRYWAKKFAKKYLSNLMNHTA